MAVNQKFPKENNKNINHSILGMTMVPKINEHLSMGSAHNEIFGLLSPPHRKYQSKRQSDVQQSVQAYDMMPEYSQESLVQIGAFSEIKGKLINQTSTEYTFDQTNG